MAEPGKCAGLEPPSLSFFLKKKESLRAVQRKKSLFCGHASRCAQARVGPNPTLRANIFFFLGIFAIIRTVLFSGLFCLSGRIRAFQELLLIPAFLLRGAPAPCLTLFLLQALPVLIQSRSFSVRQ